MTIEKSHILNADDELELQLADEVSQFYADPYGWVLWAFDWDFSELEGFSGPDDWQRDVLIEIGEEVQRRGFDGINPVDPIREAVASGHNNITNVVARSRYISEYIIE